jgi:hypothetical protein
VHILAVHEQDVFGMFEEIFGARGFSQQRQRGPRKGQDLQVHQAATTHIDTHYIYKHAHA